MLAILGGSVLTKMANLEITHRQVVRTPFGEPSGPVTFGNIGAHPVVFLARHGYGHTIPPHLVNYRANIHALREMGASRIVSVASVGCIRADLVPGDLLVPDQIIDYTWGRQHTFQDSTDKPVAHLDFTLPYDQMLRSLCMDAAAAAKIRVLDGGVYAAVQGPRFDTAAEVNRLERDGADMVGMTGMPEAVLAREAELAYATLAVVTNFAAGRQGSQSAIDTDALRKIIAASTSRVLNILEQLVILAS